jgi:hypothetical protein
MECWKPNDIPPLLHVLMVLREPGSLGPALPRDRAGPVVVVVSGDDLGVGGLDQLVGKT